jgi:pimeloyl-ACP methyl ester carboxylesterase
MLSVTMATLDKTLDNYPIDRDRVAVVGISVGADTAWMLASRESDYFAAIAPLSAGAFSPTPDRIAALKQMQIWAFNCRDNKACPIDPIRDAVKSFTRAGVNVHLSEIDAGTNHGSWSGAFGDFKLGNWLVAQRRGASSQLGQTIVGSARETVGFVRALVRGTIVDFFQDLFRRWAWIQLPIVVLLDVGAGGPRPFDVQTRSRHAQEFPPSNRVAESQREAESQRTMSEPGMFRLSARPPAQSGRCVRSSLQTWS